MRQFDLLCVLHLANNLQPALAHRRPVSWLRTVVLVEGGGGVSCRGVEVVEHEQANVAHVRRELCDCCARHLTRVFFAFGTTERVCESATSLCSSTPPTAVKLTTCLLPCRAVRH